MGVQIQVGILRYLSNIGDFEKFDFYNQIFLNLNQALIDERYSTYREPAHSEGASWSIAMDCIGIHYLRRMAAHIAIEGQLPEPEQPICTNPLVDACYREYLDNLGMGSQQYRFDHLLFHSDCFGFYLPVDFEGVIFPAPQLDIPGDMIGSSYRLRDECQIIANFLGIKNEFYLKPDQLLAVFEHPDKKIVWQNYPIESFVCIILYQASLKSIEVGSAIVFYEY